MNKKLLAGLFLGLGAYFLFKKVGKKKCSCEEKKYESTDGLSEMDKKCLDRAKQEMATMRFASPEASEKWKSEFIAKCKQNSKL